MHGSTVGFMGDRRAQSICPRKINAGGYRTYINDSLDVTCEVANSLFFSFRLEDATCYIHSFVEDASISLAMLKYCGYAFVLLVLATFPVWPSSGENTDIVARQHAHVRSLLQGSENGSLCQACSKTVRITIANWRNMFQFSRTCSILQAFS